MGGWLGLGQDKKDPAQIPPAGLATPRLQLLEYWNLQLLGNHNGSNLSLHHILQPTLRSKFSPVQTSVAFWKMRQPIATRTHGLNARHRGQNK
ncbi:hypothetical protein Cflav_PD0142 [Pedosphaera parvula Ellin514]|uniref:Uncharacterized protein n=1 Tax=Pedosphaera parvula (strain Ellin514) TaxID=320771 RepID=B9XSL6_PEDPL|nr:hypothetical protein Cflav_PD0142 [Pedosphaera parvula Ellin514]